MVSHHVPLVDWRDWAGRWESAQRVTDNRRDERYRVMLELVAELVGTRPDAILMVGCGTGALVSRTLERFPSTRVLGVDIDPLLVRIGREALGDANGRLNWLCLDPRGANISATLLGGGPFDAVLGLGAFDQLSIQERLVAYSQIREVMYQGGLFLSTDQLTVNAPASRFTRAAHAVRLRMADLDASLQRLDSVIQDRDGWWQSVHAEPEFAELLAERDQLVPPEVTPGVCLSAALQRGLMGMAGFTETALVWRYLDEAIVGGLR